MNNHKIIRSTSIPSESIYHEGRTELNQPQVKLLEKISEVLYGYPNNYDNLHLSYAPSGVIAVLRDQVIAKVDNRTINTQEEREALQLIRKLQIELEMDFY